MATMMTRMKEGMQGLQEGAQRMAKGMMGSGPRTNSAVAWNEIGVVLCGAPNSLAMETGNVLRDKGATILLIVEHNQPYAAYGGVPQQQVVQTTTVQQQPVGAASGMNQPQMAGTQVPQQHKEVHEQQTSGGTGMQHQGQQRGGGRSWTDWLTSLGSSSGSSGQQGQQYGGQQPSTTMTGQQQGQPQQQQQQQGGYQQQQQHPHHRDRPEIIPANDPQLKTRLQDLVKQCRDKGHVVVGVDASEHPSSQLFQENSIPFVMRSSGGSGVHTSLQQTKSLAVIDEDFDKYSRLLEEAFEYLGKRFPGVLSNDWRVDGKECMPEHEQEYDRSTDRIIDNIDRMAGRAVAQRAIKKVRDNKMAAKDGIPQEYLDCHMYQQIKLESPDGKVCLKIEQRTLGERAEAEGIVDSVMFLAHKSCESARPRTWKLTDVMAENIQQLEQEGEQARYSGKESMEQLYGSTERTQTQPQQQYGTKEQTHQFVSKETTPQQQQVYQQHVQETR